MAIMNFVLDNYKKMAVLPDGKRKFSEFVCQITPYFASIEPLVEELRPGYGKWSMKKRVEVQNHLQTVHAIAMCNLCEVTAGLTTEVSIPEHKRWIPIGMTVRYLKKAKTDLTAECNIEGTDWETVSDLKIDVDVKDTDGVVVMQAEITMKVSDKPTES